MHNMKKCAFHDVNTDGSMNLYGSAWAVSNPVHVYSIYGISQYMPLGDTVSIIIVMFVLINGVNHTHTVASDAKVYIT